jgi:hypothetical protein
MNEELLNEIKSDIKELKIKATNFNETGSIGGKSYYNRR